MSLTNRLISEFGSTDRPELAGYIVETGEMLDFNEEDVKGPWSIRTLDHRAVCRVYDIQDDCNGYKSMVRALDDGLIRIDYNKREKHLYINVHRWPSESQFNTLKRLCNISKTMTIDFDGDNIGEYGINCRNFRDIEYQMSIHCK